MWALLPSKTRSTRQCPVHFQSDDVTQGRAGAGQGAWGQGAGRAGIQAAVPSGACGSGETGGCGFVRKRGC